MAEIVFSSVSKAYGSKQVLRNLDFKIPSGECFTILGPSGCGKTVILRLIAGFEIPDAGEIRIGDRVVAEARRCVPTEERNIAVVFQDYAVWPHMTVMQNVLYPLDMRKVPKDVASVRALSAVKQVNLGGLENRLPFQLSGGQQQRVALARALVSKPAVMLLDEPLSNLDANLREEMRFEIKELQKKTGATILYVTHDQEVALAISDRIAVMDASGGFRQVGTPEEIYETPADPFVFRFMGVSNFIPVDLVKGTTYLRGTSVAFPSLPESSARQGINRYTAACRPMEVELKKSGGDLSGAVVRKALLGAIIDYRIDLGGVVVRAQVQTEEAVAKELLFDEGDRCGVSLNNLVWFPEETAEEEIPA